MTHVIVFYYKTLSRLKVGSEVMAVLITQDEVESASCASVKEPREREKEENKAQQSGLDVLALSLVVLGHHLKH